METQRAKFNLGRKFLTRGARDALFSEDILMALRKHSRGDWGVCSPEDRIANEQALTDGSRVFSVYKDPYGVKFWIITEADRSATTILLPEDY